MLSLFAAVMYDRIQSLEQQWKKTGLSQRSGYEKKRKGESQVLRAVVQHENDRRVKREKGQLLHFT